MEMAGKGQETPAMRLYVIVISFSAIFKDLFSRV